MEKDSGSCADRQERPMKADPELEPFGRLIEALEPWLDDVVVITGWAHRLYRLDRRAAALKYSPLTTLDSDVAIPPNIEVKGGSIRDRLLAAGFKEECVGEDRPPATHYHLGTRGGFYAESHPLVETLSYGQESKAQCDC